MVGQLSLVKQLSLNKGIKKYCLFKGTADQEG
jgi:hypothetical protein